MWLLVVCSYVWFLCFIVVCWSLFVSCYLPKALFSYLVNKQAVVMQAGTCNFSLKVNGFESVLKSELPLFHQHNAGAVLATIRAQLRVLLMYCTNRYEVVNCQDYYCTETTGTHTYPFGSRQFTYGKELWQPDETEKTKRKVFEVIPVNTWKCLYAVMGLLT